MGLPEILIEFIAKAETAIRRSSNGTVAVILADDTKSGEGNMSYSYATAADYGLSSSWTTTNRRFLNLIFADSPKKVLVERIATKDTGYEAALARLRNKKWNWLCIPGIADADVEGIKDWIIAQRSAKKTFKAVLPNCAANNEGIVNFTTTGIKCGSYSHSTANCCARIAGLLAGLPMNESATYFALDDVDSVTESVTPDADIDAGKFILINDGEKIKVGRGVNSLATLSGSKTEDMKKIKIVEGMDLMRDDIRDSFENNYIGINNSYDMGVSGTWSAKIKKIYSRGKEYAESLAAGIDERLSLIGKLEDPDNGGIERVQLKSCWLDELTLQAFENGKLTEEEYSGGFTGFTYLDDIADPCV